MYLLALERREQAGVQMATGVTDDVPRSALQPATLERSFISQADLPLMLSGKVAEVGGAPSLRPLVSLSLLSFLGRREN